MTEKQPYNSVTTLAGDHIEEFSRCPRRFYLARTQKRPRFSLTWKQAVQRMVRQVIRHYFQFPVQARCVASILTLIDTYWVKRPYHTSVCYGRFCVQFL